MEREGAASPRTLGWEEERPALGDERRHGGVWRLRCGGQGTRNARQAWTMLCWAFGSMLTVLGMAKSKAGMVEGALFS